MNYKIYILVFFCSFMSFCVRRVSINDTLSGNYKYKIYDNNGELNSKGRVSNGSKTGKWKYYFRGKLYKTIIYKDNDTIVKEIINLGDR